MKTEGIISKPARISYVNGKFIDHEQTTIHLEDRGFQFADGVYEVILFHNQKLVDFDWHIERLNRSLKEIGISFAYKKEELRQVFLMLFEKNHLSDGFVYLQITRGVAPRTQICPDGLKPTIVATVSKSKKISDEEFNEGFAAITHPDLRWLRCDIKSIGLLASVMAKHKAEGVGAVEAILHRDGEVTEGSFSNIFIVNKSGQLQTHPANNLILCGITRNRIIELGHQNNIKTEQHVFSVDELLAAREVFLTSSTLMVRPIVKIDGKKIGDGKVGVVTKKLNQLYREFVV